MQLSVTRVTKPVGRSHPETKVKLTSRSPISTGFLGRLDVQSDLAFDLICLEDLSLHLQYILKHIFFKPNAAECDTCDIHPLQSKP